MSQTSIVKFSELDKDYFNLSSEYYNPFVVQLDREYKNNPNVSTLKEISLSNGIRDFGSFSLYNNIRFWNKDDSGGIPFLRVIDISENYVNHNPILQIDEFSHKLLVKSQVRKNDLIYSIIGTLGICSVFLKEISCNSNQNLAKISIDKEKANPFYVAVYLNSNIGKALALRDESGGSQKHISLGRTKNIPLFLLSKEQQDKIGELYRNSLICMSESVSVYQEAENDLLNELKLSNFIISEKKTFKANFLETNTFQRWDSNFYQPKYEEIINKLNSYPKGVVKIKQEFSQNNTPFKRDKENYNYVEIKDINIFTTEAKPTTRNIQDLPPNCRIELNKKDLLISKVRPYRGAVSIIDEDFENLVGSSAFTILREKGKIKKEILLMLLRTKFYKELMMKYNVGTTYPVIKGEDILNLPIPLIKDYVQIDIVNKINKFYSLRKKSNELLKEAKNQLIQGIRKEINVDMFT